ncbi:MAG: DUF2891 domain-containing protein [Pseudomonadota bacterium]
MTVSRWSLALVALAACSAPQNENGVEPEGPAASFDRPEPVTLEDRFAVLALDCVHREYPNKISHVLQSAADAKTPHELTPAFYGCFDWHSSVHGHWLLTRLLKTAPDSVLASEVRAVLAKSFTPANLAAELQYYTVEGRASFERPYGVAWYLQLILELEESDDPQVTEWRETLRPLEQAIVKQVRIWLPKLAYPVRLGTHNQTAFAFGLMLDYARGVGDENLEADLVGKALTFHSTDVNCPLAYEPSGEDFLSPCLMEADLMRRVLSREVFSDWLTGFLPQIPIDGTTDWLEPGIVLDASDGKLVHLDGVNLSRAWALEGIASALPENDPRQVALMASSSLHREIGIAAVSDEHYSGSHWLASFAAYLTTKRGISSAPASGDR